MFVCRAFFRTGFLRALAGLALSLTVACGARATADTGASPIAFGPYVYDVTPTSAIIRWATVKADANAAEAGPSYEFHEKKLAGLKPGKKYPYDVLGRGAPEGKGVVTTFSRGPHPYRFAAYGDTRSRDDVHQRIVDRVIEEKPLFVINTGDLVSDGSKVSEWAPFFRINRELMRSMPYFPVLGNHEKNAKMFFDVFRQSESQRYRSFIVGDVLFLMLDSEAPAGPPETRLPYMTQQKAWVEKTLNENQKVGFVVACFHKPLYTLVAKRAEEAAGRRDFWGDIFERHGVQMVLCGHDHYYHRATHGGTQYVTTGGGGAPLYEIDGPQPETVKSAKIEHYLTVDVALDKATVKVIDIDGNPIEQFEVLKRKP